MRTTHALAALLVMAMLLAACGGAGQTVKADPAAGGTQAADAPSDEGGTPMRLFTLKDMTGRPFDLRSHLGKDVVMLSFWATWCAPCKNELERMSKVYEALKDQGFVYLAVSTDGPASVAQVRPYIQGLGYTFPVLLDTQTEVMSRYNPRGDMPFYLLVDRAGRIVDIHQGFTPGDEVEIEKRVRALLGVQAQASP